MLPYIAFLYGWELSSNACNIHLEEMASPPL